MTLDPAPLWTNTAENRLCVYSLGNVAGFHPAMPLIYKEGLKKKLGLIHE